MSGCACPGPPVGRGPTPALCLGPWSSAVRSRRVTRIPRVRDSGTVTTMPHWPLILHTIAVAALVAVMVGLSHVLGERHRDGATDSPYESGIVPTRDAPPRYTAQFYLVAAFFVIFDLELVFLFSWALVAREAGMVAFVEIVVFVAVLLVALAWAWRIGALDWAPRARERSVSRRSSR